MAIESNPEEAGGGEGHEAPKKSASKVVIVAFAIAMVMVLLGVGGYLAFSTLGAAKKKGGKEAAVAKSEGEGKGESKGEGKGEAGGGEENKMGVFVSLEPFVVNLISDSGKRYLKVTIQIEMAKAESAGEVNNRMPQIKDAIITLLSSKSTEELLTIEGKFKTKEQILSRINNLLTTGVVRNVYFVEFVIQ